VISPVEKEVIPTRRKLSYAPRTSKRQRTEGEDQ